MNVKKEHKKSKCPGCGSREIFTQNLDQICLDCDWTNSQLLVELGQMDHPILAAKDQFTSDKTFESLKETKSNSNRSTLPLNLGIGLHLIA